MRSVAEPSNAELLRAIEDLTRSIAGIDSKVDSLRFEMTQQFAAVINHIKGVENRIVGLETRLGALEDRVEMQGVTVRAIWDHLSGGDEHAA